MLVTVDNSHSHQEVWRALLLLWVYNSLRVLQPWILNLYINYEILRHIWISHFQHRPIRLLSLPPNYWAFCCMRRFWIDAVVQWKDRSFCHLNVMVYMTLAVNEILWYLNVLVPLPRLSCVAYCLLLSPSFKCKLKHSKFKIFSVWIWVTQVVS